MRVELYHPLFIHFPIALLTVGSVFRAISLPAGKLPALRFLRPTAWTILAIGVIFAWIAVGTGLVAQPEVAPYLCEPSILTTHMNLGWSTASLFSGTLFFDALATWGYHKVKQGTSARRIFPAIASLLYIASLIVIAYTGTLGSGLVYDQGAAVEKKCTGTSGGNPE